MTYFSELLEYFFFLSYSDEEDEEKQKRQVSKPKNRGKPKNIHADETVEVDSDELNDLKEMNNSFLKKKNCVTTGKKKAIKSVRASTSKKFEKKGRRIRMLEDSSSDEEKPARKVEISDDGDGGNSKRGSSDGSSCPENQENEDPRQSAEIEVENIDNTYDYNDSFIDDNSRSGHNFLFTFLGLIKWVFLHLYPRVGKLLSLIAETSGIYRKCKDEREIISEKKH